MGRPASAILTDAELRIMRVLWARTEATSVEIVDAIGDPPLARNTVMTTLGVLERKGYVTHRADGRTFVYTAVVGQDAARSGALESLIQRFFDGSAKQLVVKLLDDVPLGGDERARIERLLADLEDA